MIPRASDPKLEGTFGIDPMLNPLSGASSGADPEGRVSDPKGCVSENRVRFSARCASDLARCRVRSNAKHELFHDI
jgi:hypothetical protein